MAASLDLLTVSGRLATFDVAHQTAPRGRTSNAKSAKTTTWTHSRPSAEELAHAGFYYAPTAVSPDNVICFLCERSMDGWDEDDDPFIEHLTHSSGCGWAIMMNIARRSSNPAEIQDPTSPIIEEARRATFITWPHERKKGWVCKTEKLVEAGWYFCPNEESDDLVSCAYCNLSLDGWEPKDKPYDEHYRRSSDCSFFQFAPRQKRASRSSRSKSTRSSKASRISTQSAATAVSEASAMDLDETMDDSMLSQATNTKPAKGSKKAAKPKAKGSKAKKSDDVEESFQNDNEEPSGEKDNKVNGKKRKSDDMSEGFDGDSGPKTKKRATTSTARNSKQRTTSSISRYVEAPTDDELSLDAGSQLKKRGRKKASTASTRKPSVTFQTPIDSTHPDILDDNAIDAALEADLARGSSNEPESTLKEENQDPSDAHEAPSTAPAKPRGKKGKQSHDNSDVKSEETSKKGTQKKTQAKGKSKKKGTAEALDGKSSGFDWARTGDSRPDVDMDESVVPDADVHDDYEEDDFKYEKSRQTAKSRPAANNTKKPQKKKTDENIIDNSSADAVISKDPPKAAKAKNGKASRQKSIESDGKDVIFDDNDAATSDLEPSNYEHMEEPVPQDGKSLGGRMNNNNDNSSLSEGANLHHNRQGRTPLEATRLTPSRYQQNRTPSASPQSSDAENRPPPSMTSANPSMLGMGSQSIRMPLPTSTPIASPSKKPFQPRVKTSYPWHPADLDDVFQTDPDNKENISLEEIFQAAKDEITSAEKQMTVEEWIYWGAKKSEEKLRNECERVVGIFEKEGGRAMRALEGIECVE